MAPESVKGLEMLSYENEIYYQHTNVNTVITIPKYILLFLFQPDLEPNFNNYLKSYATQCGHSDNEQHNTGVSIFDLVQPDIALYSLMN